MGAIVFVTWIVIYFIFQLVFLPIKWWLNRVSFNHLKVGDYVFTEREWWFEYGNYVPVNSAKIVNIIRNQKGKIEFIELDNEQKMAFKEYNKILQF
jgi:hypothetical protein